MQARAVNPTTDPKQQPRPVTAIPPISATIVPSAGPKVGEPWEKVRNWTQGEQRGRVSGVWSAPLPLLAQEDPQNEVIVFIINRPIIAIPPVASTFL
eukprot:1970357-Pyramimonas_sp.AAC.1